MSTSMSMNLSVLKPMTVALARFMIIPVDVDLSAHARLHILFIHLPISMSVPIPISMSMPIQISMSMFMSTPMQNKVVSPRADNRPGGMREAIRINDRNRKLRTRARRRRHLTYPSP